MPDPRERPIIFSAPMVRAILAGRKTQTRRVVKPVQPRADGMWPAGREPVPDCPYGQPGDRLWVRESFKDVASGSIKRGYGEVRYGVAYRADSAVVWRPNPTIIHGLTGFDTGPLQFERRPWKPSIHMPRRASRITLEITGVRVEQLQDISEADARDEGAIFHDGLGVGHSGWRHDDGDTHADARSSFARLWNQINGKDSWAANPWVWVIEFQKLRMVE